MKTIITYFLAIVLLPFIAGCLPQNVKKLHVIQVSDSNPLKIKAEEQKVFFKFNQVRDSVTMGKVFEVQSRGEECTPFMTYIKGAPDKQEAGQTTFSSYTNWIVSELQEYNIKTSNVNLPVSLDAVITDWVINSCYIDPGATSLQGKSETYVSVRWILAENGKEIYSRTTQGYGIVSQFSSNTPKSLEDALRMSTRKLLSDNEFMSILTFNDSQKKQGPSSNTIKVNANIVDKPYEKLTINQSKSKTLNSDKSEWVNGVFTVYTDQGHGSGFAISDNYILTNYHVIENQQEDIVIKMAQDDGSFKAWNGKVIRQNVKRDIALIKIDGRLNKYFSIDNNKVNQGDDVFVMGSPLSADHESTLTKGIISHHNRVYGDLSFIQSDANIYGGNSGGPMITSKGNVLGISVMSHGEAEGLNLFIPIQSGLESLNIKIQ